LSPERRVGAALALKAAGATEAVRVAASEEPSPHMHKMLEEMAEGEVEDAEIEKVLRWEKR
jgi:hypothetical protein